MKYVINSIIIVVPTSATRMHCVFCVTQQFNIGNRIELDWETKNHFTSETVVLLGHLNPLSMYVLLY